jgi:hypothetical protein
MATVKAIAKWLAILIGFLILMALLQDVEGYVRVGLGLGIFIGFMFHAVNKRLDVIEGHLLKLRAGSEN